MPSPVITPVLRAAERNPAAPPSASLGAKLIAAAVLGEEKNPFPQPTMNSPTSSNGQSSPCVANAASTNPHAATSIPPDVARRVFLASPIRPPARDVAPTPIPIGRKASPAITGPMLCPCSNQYGRIAKHDISVPVLRNVAAVADTKRDLRRKRGSIIGFGAMNSAETSRSSAIQATENHAIAG